MPNADPRQYPSQPVDLELKRNEDLSANESIYSFKLALWMAAILIVSGLFHLAKLGWDGADWNGPLSLRKPGLFGVSAGLTVWSIVWLMTQLRPLRFDRILTNMISGSLLIEVGLITWQHWRGVPSHFNHATRLDGAIEATMLVLILFVTASIFYLTLRTFRLRSIERSKAIAIRGGMWLLSVSCGLGILTSILGEVNIAADRPYETWGRAGVLKFPHGMALHAIQLLPMLSWFVRRLRVAHPVRLIRAALVSQVLFQIYAIRQTLQGRDRFDWDTLGGFIFGITCLLCIYPATVITRALALLLRHQSKYERKDGMAKLANPDPKQTI